MKPVLAVWALLFVGLATEAADQVVTIELPPPPEFNMIEHIRNMPKPQRALCRSLRTEECSPEDNILVFGSISDGVVRTLVPLTDAQRTRAIRITGDNRAAEVITAIGDIGFERFLCYRIRDEWKCTSLGASPYCPPQQQLGERRVQSHAPQAERSPL